MSPPTVLSPSRVAPRGVGESREVERAVMNRALREIDDNNITLAERNKQLQEANAVLKMQLQAALKMNGALVRFIS